MIQLSPSKLNLLNDCPRCFWLANVKKIARPRGIFPSLPGGIDRRMKDYFDKFRGEGVPPELEGKLPGMLFSNKELLRQWRNWRTGLVYFDPVQQVKLIGALDDCLVNDYGRIHIPLDYKSKGSEPKDDGSQYYQTQLDCYELMLQSNGFKTCGKACLVYVYPVDVVNASEIDALRIDGVIKDMYFRFEVKVYEIKTDTQRAKEKIAHAVKIINGTLPAASDTCEYCELVERRIGSEEL